MTMSPFGMLEEYVACRFHRISTIAGCIGYIDVNAVSAECLTSDWVVYPFSGTMTETDPETENEHFHGWDRGDFWC